jgi:hypothetical protein
MNLLFHHIRKDLRHSRWLIALTWLAAAGILWLPATPVEKRVEVMQWLPLIRYGSWTLLFLTIGRIVQLDAPLRDTAFLRSRPVSSSEWLSSKLVASVILMLPIALLQVAMILFAGLRPESIDLLLILAEEVLVLGVIALIAMTIAARTKTYSDFIAAAIGIAFASFIVFAIYANTARWLNRDTKPTWSYDNEYLKLSKLLIAHVITAFGLLGSISICFRARSVERLPSFIAGTVVVAALAWFFWPMNFVKSLTRPEAAAPRSEWPDQSKIDFAFVEGRFDDNDKSTVSWGFGGYNDWYYQRISAFTRMEGLDPKWFAYPNGYASRLKSPSAEIAVSSKAAFGFLTDELILPHVGIPDSWKRVNGATQVDIGEFPIKAIKAAGEDATLEGLVHIPLKRPVVLARIPLKAGARARIGHRRITITSVGVTRPDRISYQVIEERSMSRLRGGWYGEPYRRIEMIAINSERGEFLKSQGAGHSNLSTTHYTLSRMDYEDTIWLDYSKPDQDRNIPPGWLDGAELIITGDEYGGTITRGFRFENLNLIDTSWRP